MKFEESMFFNENRLLTESEASRLLGVSTITLRKRRYAGLAPSYVKFGGNIRYRLQDVLAFIGESRRELE